MTSAHDPSRFDDVRMRGFRKRSTVEATLAWIDRQATRLESENLAIHQACGRVLARSVYSTVAVPAFCRAMMDGFAVRATDTLGATSYDPLYVDVIGQVLPGANFDGQIARGEAVRIMTGAPMPAGADAVLPAERCSVSNEHLAILDQVAPGKHVGQIGEDIPLGTEVLTAGRRLRPQDLGVLSSIGQGTVDVIRKPRVRLLITGDELCAAGSLPKQNQTVDANSPMLAALVARDGGTVLFDGITPDQPDAIQEAMEDATVDVVIVSGGSSVGQEDHAPRILAELGELAIHGVAMRPSSPTGMGCIGHRLVFLLPGNPVSCLCAYDFFAGRAIRLLGGKSAAWPYATRVGVLSRKISSVLGRQDYARVKVHGASVEPIAISGASALSSTSVADGFVLVPADSEGFPPDAEVEVFLYDQVGC